MTTRPQAVPTTQIDNERVIVTEWRFAPGAETGWHRHGHDNHDFDLDACLDADRQSRWN